VEPRFPLQFQVTSDTPSSGFRFLPIPLNSKNELFEKRVFKTTALNPFNVKAFRQYLQVPAVSSGTGSIFK
jgi:hypothetical protein